MSIADRKTRERAQRQDRITHAARAIAENESWSAVTIRRLAREIEYSQPVVYSHFENRDAIVAAVAVEGFRELGRVVRQALEESDQRQQALGNVAGAYLAFAREHPAVYEAMFTLPTSLQFADAASKAELKEAFAILGGAIAPSRCDVEVATETFWAALHGLAELEHRGRIRPSARDERVAFVVRGLLDC